MTNLSEPPVLAHAVTRRSRRLSVIWIIPLVAVAIGAWLAWDTLSKEGPTITVTFNTAEGLQPGQSQLKFKDIVFGTVKSLKLAPDNTHVVVTIATTHDAKPLLTEKTVFWVVKPRLFAGNVSGLETLLSGSYIGMLPGATAGKPKHKFTGQEDPPILSEHVPGHTFLMKAKRLGSLSLGSPIFYRYRHLRDVPRRGHPAIHEQFRAYRATLQDDRRRLLEKFEIVDAARKVVGVGSVGTRAFIVLLQGRDEQDPLFLQVKEATASVLEAYLPKSRYRQHGARVVQGQRMMQAASDIFLGWTKGVDVTRNFYWRQLRDMKGSAVVELMAPVTLRYYAQICGWTLARAHARSGDPVAMAAYLGRVDAFERSVTDFSERYADQNEQDYGEFAKAIRSGRLQAVEGV